MRAQNFPDTPLPQGTYTQKKRLYTRLVESTLGYTIEFLQLTASWRSASPILHCGTTQCVPTHAPVVADGELKERIHS